MINIKIISLISVVIYFCSFEAVAKIKGTALELLPSGHLIVDVVIKGETAKFIVDTGASSSVIDKKLVKKLSLTPLSNEASIQGYVPGEHVLEMLKYRLNEVDLGGLVKSEIVFVEQDLSPMFQGLSQYEIQGIIGQEILAKFGLLLDVSKAKLYLPNEQLLKGYTATHIQTTAIGLSFIEIEINQIKLNMFIDSGATEVMIDKEMAIKHNVGEISYDNQMEGVGENGNIRKIGLIEHSIIMIAGRSIDSLLLVDDFSGLLSQVNPVALQGEISGLIGVSALAKLSAIIDVKNQRLYIN
ncbi:pepsin/retropepsin-like aspartic protease family protein [Thalassotalea sp. 1_MG-2023]|uniref:pepsin/retropepsin-like aspartic protease family protein n=1 Tax=Thalassotalea sp. 1_MG-2023 TaxID=3062680 RepID=UPI0026E442DD|nr:pepsin/retropepsin-like aspartic protease family protein [Thalassotalea sp. 1_MG-2023]MDO6426808.1 pepsin/retropepsin-like aspartic protease family protein [Thalassotalea sp. 1_MG-2023]